MILTNHRFQLRWFNLRAFHLFMKTPISIYVVQTDLVWENTNQNLLRMQWHIQRTEPNSMVLLPEMFNTGFSMDTPKIAEPMNASVGKWMAEKSKKYTIAGSFAVKEHDQYLNRIGVFQNQKCIGTYDKKHLFTLGDEDQHFQSDSMGSKTFKTPTSSFIV